MQALICWWAEEISSSATIKGNIPLSHPHQGVPWHTAPEMEGAGAELKELWQTSDKPGFLTFNNCERLFLLLDTRRVTRTSCFYLIAEWPELTKGNLGGREREGESRALLSGPLFHRPAGTRQSAKELRAGDRREVLGSCGTSERLTSGSWGQNWRPSAA